MVLAAVNRHWGLLSFAFLATLSFLTITFLNPGMPVNDDYAMRAFADGTYTGRNEIELVFIGKLAGLALSALYSVSQEAPWYELLMLGTNFLAFFLLGLFARKSFFGIAGWITSCCTVFVFAVQSPSYTHTAIISAGLAGGLILLLAATKSADGLLWIGSILTLVVGLSWRIEAGFIVIVFIASVVLATLVVSEKKNIRGIIVGALIAFSVLGVSAAGVASLNSVCFAVDRSECREWLAWNEFNDLRGSFHESPRGEQLLTMSSGAGPWTHSESIQFLGWSYFDPKIHGVESLRRVAQDIPASAFGADLSNIFYRDFWTLSFNKVAADLQQKARQVIHWVAGLLVIVLPALVARIGLRVRVFIAFPILFSGLLGLLLLLSLVRLPDWVTRSSLALWASGILLVFIMARASATRSEDESPSGGQLTSPYAIEALVVLFGLSGLTLWSLSQGSPYFLLWFMAIFVVVLGLLGHSGVGKRGRFGVYLNRRVPSLILGFGGAFLVINVALNMNSYSPNLELTSKGSMSVYSDEVRGDWQGQLLWGPGGTGSFFQPQAYSFERQEMGRVLLGGWPTFSPHWDARITKIRGPAPSVEEFANGEYSFLGTQSSFDEFSGLDAFDVLSWESYGAYFEGSPMSVWGVAPKTMSEKLKGVGR